MSYSEYRHALIWEGALEDEKELSADQAKMILNHSRAWMLRNIYSFDCSEETNYWFILKGSHLQTDYERKTRYYVKKAHETFNVRRINLSQMRTTAFRVYHSAHSHYKVNDGFVMDEKEFDDALSELPADTEYWGCINRDSLQLDAYAICIIKDGNCWIKYLRSVRGDGQKYSPIYGLYDSILNHYLNERGLKYVTNNARSITEHSDIESYLQSKFKFRRAFCRVKLFYKPWLKLIIDILYPFRRFVPIASVHNLLKFEELSRNSSSND